MTTTSILVMVLLAATVITVPFMWWLEREHMGRREWTALGMALAIVWLFVLAHVPPWMW